MTDLQKVSAFPAAGMVRATDGIGHYHRGGAYKPRSRSADGYFASLIEHLEYSFQLEIKGQMGANGDWYGFDTYAIARRLIMGLVAKLLVSDLCRDPAIIDLFCEYTAEMLIGGPHIRAFPVLLRPIIAHSTRVAQLSNKMQQVFLNLIKYRKVKSEKMAKEGNQPEDVTDWFWRWSQHDGNNGLTELDIAQLLAANTFGASFNTTVVLVQCICELASRPEYVTLLREEVTSTLRKHNNTWTKEGLESLKKLDSFIKESHRYNCFDVMGAPRVVKQNYTFKNGLAIPKGTVLFSPNRAMLFDEKYLANPNEFDGMRFYDLAMGRGLTRPRLSGTRRRIRIIFNSGMGSMFGKFNQYPHSRGLWLSLGATYRY
ncbi:cytochrome P450 [Aspergillus puulaauensis]|uniref:Cytochrome P450 n=1 Tax=Aspergillus puulaauensis TaxID=1220207 RepID=A0A7R8AIW2_9EURO|nr:uncharacterized protein APUU_20334S [Aspergillus puulaauensis]BCS19902.1 hypothetical protein APUU_20334S [Aspergillus puulaauensis]